MQMQQQYSKNVQTHKNDEHRFDNVDSQLKTKDGIPYSE